MKYVRLLSAVLSISAVVISIYVLCITVYRIPERPKVITDTVKVYKIGTEKAPLLGPHPGEIWRYQHKPINPFDTTQHFIIYDSVIAVKEGYVQYMDMQRRTIESDETVMFLIEAKCINCK